MSRLQRRHRGPVLPPPQERERQLVALELIAKALVRSTFAAELIVRGLKDINRTIEHSTPNNEHGPGGIFK